MTDIVGRLLAARYRVEQLVDQGGMGRVFRGLDEKLDRTVAVKVLHPHLSGDRAFRERFLREQRIAAGLRHPNVAVVYDAGEDNGLMFVVMECVPGGDLRKLLANEGPLDPERCLHILGQVANALDAAHASGLIHRDVKPANVLLGAGDHALLTDFGLAKHHSTPSDLSQVGGFLGTPYYCSPEQFAGDAVDHRSDIYSLGCVLYECLSGARPFDYDSDAKIFIAHREEPPPALSTRRPDLDPALDEVVRRAMAKDPDDRYSRAGDLVAAAADLLGPSGAKEAGRGETCPACGAFAANATRFCTHCGALLSAGGVDRITSDAASDPEPDSAPEPIRSPDATMVDQRGSESVGTAVEASRRDEPSRPAGQSGVSSDDRTKLEPGGGPPVPALREPASDSTDGVLADTPPTATAHAKPASSRTQLEPPALPAATTDARATSARARHSKRRAAVWAGVVAVVIGFIAAATVFAVLAIPESDDARGPSETPSAASEPDEAILTSTFAGRVVDAETGAPVKGVRVTPARGGSDLTNQRGFFSIPDVAEDTSIHVYPPGCVYASRNMSRAEAETGAIQLSARGVLPVVGYDSRIPGVYEPAPRTWIRYWDRRLGRFATHRGTSSFVGVCPGDKVTISAPLHRAANVRVSPTREARVELRFKVLRFNFTPPQRPFRSGPVISFINGRLRVNWKQTNWSISHTLDGLKLASAEVAVDGRYVGGTDGALGIQCRTNGKNFYQLGVSTTGWVSASTRPRAGRCCETGGCRRR